MSTPRFTVIVPCHNGERWLAEALASCSAQTAADLEVLVVDDGSTDRSAAIAATAAEADRRIRCLRQPNAGVAAARNTGLVSARGEYINFLDADDLLEPEKLARQGAVLDENPDIDWVFCDGRGIDEIGALVMDHITEARRFAAGVSVFDVFFSGGQFPPLVPVIRRAALERVGGFDPDRELSGWADTELWLRLSLEGCRHYFLDERLCRYRLHGESMSGDRSGMERAAELAYERLLRRAPAAAARSLRTLHRRLEDKDAALRTLRAAITHAGHETEQALDGWRLARETLHASQQASVALGGRLHDAETRLDALRRRLADPIRHTAGRGLIANAGTAMTRVVIYDAGDAGRILWEALTARPGVEVIAFVDADTRRLGRRILNVPVHPPAWLRQVGWDYLACTAPDVDDARRHLADGDLRRLLLLPTEPDTLEALTDALFPDPYASALATAILPDTVRVGIFGTGAAAMKVWEALADIDSADAAWFADNNPAQQGRTLLWLDVIAPACIRRRPCDAIVIGSMARDPIRRQLIDLGVAPAHILTPDVTGPVDRLRNQLSASLMGLAERREVA